MLIFADKISRYVVPASHEDLFRRVLTELMPRQCKNKKIWLASDSAMVCVFKLQNNQ